MPYLGNIPAENYASFDKQTITGDGGTSYTLDHPVGSPQEVAIFVNNVRQEPGVAYTVTGTALTMTGDVESTDDFYAIFIGKAVQTVTHPSDAALFATDLTLETNNNATGGSPNNVLRFKDSDSTTASSQPAGAIEWHTADTDNSGPGVVGKIQSVAEGTGASYGMEFHTGNVGSFGERMRINSSGNVGIGTTSPGGQLHLDKTSDLIFGQNGYGIAWGGNNGSPRIYGASGGNLNFKHGGGSEGLRIDSSANIKARAEGGSGLIIDLRQGSAKAWLNNKQFNGNSTRDSYNISSVTDHGTGDFAPQINNDMNSVNYAWTAAGQRGDNANEDLSIAGYSNTFTDANVTSSTRLVSYHSSSSNQTGALANNVAWHGDLA